MKTELIMERLRSIVERSQPTDLEHSERSWVIYEISSLFGALKSDARSYTDGRREFSKEETWVLDVLRVGGDFEGFCIVFRDACKQSRGDFDALYRLSCEFFYNDSATVEKFLSLVGDDVEKDWVDRLLEKLRRFRVIS
ncbi:MAG: hypothetical protein AAFR73_10130 [Pseudomonadota bacterium]